MSKSSDPDYVCPVFATSGKCGEQDALQVMDRFRLFYERKLCEVHDQGGGDCMELKLKIQQRWIEDLTEQTQMMARIVKELEDEATTRVRMLEDKLRQTSKNAYEDAPLNADIEESLSVQSVEEVKDLLRQKTEEFEILRQNMLDMRSALTEEVACKHDMISALKKEVQQLEERCIQSDKQTAFKDDIIKELRKEIKQIKKEICLVTKRTSHRTVLTTIRHSRNVEKPKTSTVIFVNDSKRHETKSRSKEDEKNLKSFLDASYLKEVPVKEKSIYTITTFKTVGQQN